MTSRMGTREAASQILREVCSCRAWSAFSWTSATTFAPAGQRRFHRFDLEGVDQRAGVGQGVDGRAQFETRLADLHPQPLRLSKRFFGGVDALLELIQVGAEGARGLRPGEGGPELALLHGIGCRPLCLPSPASRRRAA